jgi:hypothetical protein
MLFSYCKQQQNNPIGEFYFPKHAQFAVKKTRENWKIYALQKAFFDP